MSPLFALTLGLSLQLVGQPGQAGQPDTAASQPGSQPGSQAAPGTARDVSADLTIIFETNERALQVQEDWTLSSSRTVPPKELEIPMPAGAKKLHLEDGSRGFKASESSRAITASEALSGKRQIQSSFLLDLSGSDIEVQRPIPFSVPQARVVVQDVPGLSVTTSAPSQRRLHDLNGVSYVIWDMQDLKAGSTLQIRISGLPANPRWPRHVALAGVVLVLLWMVYALRAGVVPGEDARTGANPLAPAARRDQIVKAIEVLERDFAAEKVKEKRYQRRKKELMQELALVLKELELAKDAGRTTASARSA